MGSVVLWDLREYASDHYHLTIEEEEWTFRQPTFSTGTLRLFSYVTAALTRCTLIPSVFIPCQRRCGYGQLGSFLACDVRRSRAFCCSRRAEVRGPPFGISGRYGMHQEGLGSRSAFKRTTFEICRWFYISLLFRLITQIHQDCPFSWPPWMKLEF